MTDSDAVLDEAEPVEMIGGVVVRFRRFRIAAALQIAGGALVAVAAGGVSVILGVFTAGVGLIVFGIAIELEGKQPSDSS